TDRNPGIRVTTLATRLLHGKLFPALLSPRYAIAPHKGRGRIPWRGIFGSVGWITLALFLGLFLGLCAAILPMRVVEVPLAVIGVVSVLVVWGLPHVRRVPLATARRVFLLYVPVFCTLPTYLAIYGPGLPWISIHRVLLALLALLFAYCWGGSPT